MFSLSKEGATLLDRYWSKTLIVIQELSFVLLNSTILKIT